jgi:hypothetical protein
MGSAAGLMGNGMAIPTGVLYGHAVHTKRKSMLACNNHDCKDIGSCPEAVMIGNLATIW